MINNLAATKMMGYPKNDKKLKVILLVVTPTFQIIKNRIMTKNQFHLGNEKSRSLI